MATNVFDMPASLFARYLEFFDIETATPMQTWDQGTRSIYENMSTHFPDKIYLNRPVRKVYRQSSHVVVEDEDDVKETFDEVIFACNAESDAHDPRQTYVSGASYSLFDTLRERTAQPYSCAFGLLSPSG